MVLDPKKHADWEIAQDAETRMKTVQQLGRDMGLLDKELLPYGHVMGKVDYRAVLERLGDKPNGKYVDVTAITPHDGREGLGRGRRAFPVHPFDAIFPGFYRRYQRGDERP